jgi:hypothetical protein
VSIAGQQLTLVGRTIPVYTKPKENRAPADSSVSSSTDLGSLTCTATHTET